MARLRKTVAEPVESNTEDWTGNATFSAGRTPTIKHPQDELNPSTRSTRGVSTLDKQGHVALRQKTPQKCSDFGKKIKLTTLRSLPAGTCLLNGSFSCEETRSQRQRDGSQSIRVRATKTALEQRMWAPRNHKVPSFNTNVDDNDRQEESDASSSESSNEVRLPSPRNFLGARVRTRPDLPTERREISDANISLGEMIIAAYPQTPPKKVSSQKASVGKDSSRPSASSSIEDPLAILQFSPPRLQISPRKPSFPEDAITPPQSPTKSRLQSPSKMRAKVPQSHLRPSLDAFWNSGTINDWNDQYSPEKALRSPKKFRRQQIDDFGSGMAVPSKSRSPSKLNKLEMDVRRDFNARKHQISELFLGELDATIAEGRVSQLSASTGGVRVVWSKTLNSTAGRANWRRETVKSRELNGTVTQIQKHHASIELAEKVIDDEHRLLNVIAHEFCHLCNFMISGIKDQPHGKQFKVWGSKCTTAFADRGIEVTTKHSYEIEYKYIWECSNETCEALYKRHSKSVDPTKHTCGSCKSKLTQIKPIPRKTAGQPPTGYAAFVKLHFAAIKTSMPAATQKQIMEAVGQKYRAEKEAAAAAVHVDTWPSEKQAFAKSYEATNIDDLVGDLAVVTLDDD